MALDGAGQNAPDGGGTRDPAWVVPHRRYPGDPPRGRATHAGRRAALRGGLDQVQRLADARRMRLVAAEEDIPGVLWAALAFGGAATMGFTYPFGLESTWAHRLMVAGPGGGNRAGAVHRRRLGVPLLRQRPYRHGGLRAGTGEVRDQQAQRPPIAAEAAPIHRSSWKEFCELRAPFARSGIVASVASLFALVKDGADAPDQES